MPMELHTSPQEKSCLYTSMSVELQEGTQHTFLLSELIWLTITPCLQCLSNANIASTTHTQLPVTNSKSSFLLEERAHTWTPALRMLMSPVLNAAGTEGTLFLCAFSTHSDEKSRRINSKKERKLSSLRSSSTCICG